MIKKFTKHLKSEDGAMAIVEATFVFPIMFFVIFFLIFMGNMYVSKAYTDNLINEKALEIAANCSDPNLTTINSNGEVTTDINSFDNQPYRYIFNDDVAGGSNSVVTKSIAKGKSEILNDENGFNSFFKGMQPQLNESDLHIKFNNHIINYTLSVTATYKISLPWKFIFQNDIDIYTFTTHAEVPVSDAPEFIRNIDMAIDYAQQSETINNLKEKISSIFGNKDGSGGGNAIKAFKKNKNES